MIQVRLTRDRVQERAWAIEARPAGTGVAEAEVEAVAEVEIVETCLPLLEG